MPALAANCAPGEAVRGVDSNLSSLGAGAVGCGPAFSALAAAAFEAAFPNDVSWFLCSELKWSSIGAGQCSLVKCACQRRCCEKSTAARTGLKDAWHTAYGIRYTCSLLCCEISIASCGCRRQRTPVLSFVVGAWEQFQPTQSSPLLVWFVRSRCAEGPCICTCSDTQFGFQSLSY